MLSAGSPVGRTSNSSVASLQPAYGGRPPKGFMLLKQPDSHPARANPARSRDPGQRVAGFVRDELRGVALL